MDNEKLGLYCIFKNYTIYLINYLKSLHFLTWNQINGAKQTYTPMQEKLKYIHIFTYERNIEQFWNQMIWKRLYKRSKRFFVLEKENKQ